MTQAEDGVAGITAYLHSLGYEATFRDVFRDWLVANHLDAYVMTQLRDYSYEGLDVSVPPIRPSFAGIGEHSGSAGPVFAGDYLEMQPCLEGDASAGPSRGNPTTPILPTTAHSGSHCWWGNRGDAIDSSLTTTVANLSQVRRRPRLSFWTWYSIEESWDYAYVEVSTDGGETWIGAGGPSSLHPKAGWG